MATVTIDATNFCKRLKKLYDHWKANDSASWSNATSIAILVGATSEDLRYLKSISLQLWLFGYELPDTVMVFTKSDLHVLTSSKKVDLLKPLTEQCQQECGVQMILHAKPKDDATALMQQLLATAKEADPDSLSPHVGTLLKDDHSGKTADLFNQTFCSDSGITLTDVAPGIASLLSSKDSLEILNVKKAAMLASRVMKDFVVVKQIEEVLNKGRPVKHSKLSQLTEEVITDPSKINIKLKPENVDIAYPPVFQSGGKFDLKVGVLSDDSNLNEGVIVVSIGARYASYCANISRTFLVDPTPKQESEYLALLSAQEKMIASLVDGAMMSTVVEAGIEVLRSKGQEHLIQKLGKNMGFGMGLELRESSNMLTSKNDGMIRAGMVFNVSIGAQGLENPDATDSKNKIYAIQIADTIVVAEAGKSNEIATNTCPRNWDKVVFKTDADEEVDADVGIKFEDMTNGAIPMRKTLRSDDPSYKSAEQVRKEKQEELLRQKNEETLKRLTAVAGDGTGAASTSGRPTSEIVAYRSVADIPAIKDLVIQVDTKSEAVLLPIYGIHVPFHITTIKNVTSSQDHDRAFIRVTFNFGATFDPFIKSPSSIFLKELSFKSSDIRHANKTVQDIKLLRSSVLQRDKERMERATLVVQEKLISGKKVFKLPDLWIRPNFGGKGRKLPGTLEAHANGFRYSNPKNETVNVMYRNIKHAFFQPADNEVVTILHFHLINPIMLGNKKTRDVQFYTEVMEVVQTLDAGRRNAFDPDEIEEEQRERDRRNKINHEFNQFVKRVQELWERDYHELGLEFDIPFRELGFHGTPFKSAVFIMPTVNCLIELTEMPFCVVSLSDIEIINLERVGFNLKNFDMAIVFKDFSKEVMRIDAIPTKSLETIKDWLTSVKIKYYESKLNLAWKPVLKSIVDDPEGFFEQGGWEFLNMEKSDSDDEGGEEQSEDYAPSGSEEEEEEDSDDDDDSDEESVVDSDDDDGEDGSEDDEGENEEGLSWEELEAEAKKSDARHRDSDSEDDRKRAGGKKRTAGGASGTATVKRRK